MRRALRDLPNALFLRPSQEIVYRELFIRDLMKLGLADDFYPVRGAANHGLLYLIARCFMETEVRSVIEFGVGQTSILIDQLSRVAGHEVRVASIEHDEDWATRIADKVSHEITVAPLVNYQVAPQVAFYDPTLIPNGPFEMMIVDGPVASSKEWRFARTGFCQICAERLAEDFVIVIDDAERLGERMLVSQTRNLLTKQGRKFNEGEVRALKRQYVFAGGRHSHVAYF